MNQKQALEKIINYMPKLAKVYFVSEWLEDINWHTENKKFLEAFGDEYIKTLELVDKYVHSKEEAPFEIQNTVEALRNYYTRISTFNAIYGYGLTTADWSSTTGDDLVTDLIEIVNK